MVFYEQFYKIIWLIVLVYEIFVLYAAYILKIEYLYFSVGEYGYKVRVNLELESFFPIYISTAKHFIVKMLIPY